MRFAGNYAHFINFVVRRDYGIFDIEDVVREYSRFVWDIKEGRLGDAEIVKHGNYLFKGLTGILWGLRLDKKFDREVQEMKEIQMAFYSSLSDVRRIVKSVRDLEKA